MQSVHSVIAKAEVAAPDVVEVVDVAEDAPAASASTPMALTTATPPTSGPLGPTVIPTVIPTLKQLQDIKRKTVVVPNNNNNYVALTSPLKPPPGAKPLPDATGSPAAEPEKTNQDQDGGEPPAKRMREDTEPGDGSPGVAVSRPPTPPRPSHTSIMSISSILSAPTTTPAWPTPSPAAIVFPPPAVPRSPSVEPPARSPSSLSGTSRPSSVGPARPPSSEPPLPPAPLPWPLLAAGPAAVAASSRILYAGPSMASYLARQASAANPHLVAASQPSPPSTGPSRLAIGSPSRSSHHDRSSSGSRSSSSSVSSGSSRTSGTSRAPPSTSRGARRAPAASARPPHASPPGAARALGVDDGREGLLDGVKHVPEFFQSVLRQHIMTQAVRSSMQKAEMIASYQPWVVLTYGDSAKTKTVTLNKYARIVRTLHGEEPHSAENSKFRFWVRSKGFRIGLPPDAAPTPPRPAEHIAGSYAADTRTGQLYLREDAVETMPVLYVPTGTSSSARTSDRILVLHVPP
ncbi:hypothetical protein ONE63_008251 [Megalurothrips usitatus]|uniref:Uncharacterized protein n=1 Tax=Megalurothrips usitatus TaxID=439358 RepID=A0AAV7XN32_9NEOP|nr:hypothetical protein ONE63_008251 [Megalurothrips usitatus]